MGKGSDDKAAPSQATLSLLVENEPGVLARVIGLFSSRGYNIESLSVSAVSADGHISRMTIVTSGSAQIVAQIVAQLERLVPVYHVENLGADENFVSCEMALFKFRIKNDESHQRLKELLQSFGAVIVSEAGGAKNQLVMVRLAESSKRLDEFIVKASSFEIVEMARTGVTSLSKGENHAGVL